MVACLGWLEPWWQCGGRGLLMRRQADWRARTSGCWGHNPGGCHVGRRCRYDDRVRVWLGVICHTRSLDKARLGNQERWLGPGGCVPGEQSRLSVQNVATLMADFMLESSLPTCSSYLQGFAEVSARFVTHKLLQALAHHLFR